MSFNIRSHPPPPSVLSSSPTPPPSQPSASEASPPDGEDLKRRLEKLSRHYDVDTMKVFMVVEGLGEPWLHAVYRAQRKQHWQAFLQRQEACRLDLARHEKTRDSYRHFLTKVSREDQGRQWFQAVLHTLHTMGAADIFQYLTQHAFPSLSTLANNYNNLLHSPRRHEALNTFRSHHNHPPHDSLHRLKLSLNKNRDVSLLPLEAYSAEGSQFCHHLIKLFEKKLETWFDSFHAIAVRLTAHVKVAGLVRVMTGQVHALCTRQGRLHAVAVKVTAQETPRPLDVAELCLMKVMVIQNGLALPEDLSLALLTLHVHPARPVLRLWLLTPSPQMETAIRVADIDDMIDAGRLSQQHELWVTNTSTEGETAATAGGADSGAEKDSDNR
ncbi:hypothetical protein ACOMHN_053793 [Nucella lapillus]